MGGLKRVLFLSATVCLHVLMASAFGLSTGREKSGGGGELEQAEGGRCTTITRLFSPSSSAYQADGFPGLSQKCLKRNYDEMIAASYGGGGVGGGGPGGQVMLTEGGCFPRPGMPPSSPSPHHPLPPPHLQQMLLYRQPYSIPLAAAGGGGSSSLSSGDEMQQHQQQLMMMGVQEPKFPPQTFEIPDIQDSNSVFGLDNGAFDGAAYHPGLGAPGSAGPNDRQAFFYGSPPVPDHSHCRTVGLMSFPGWGQQQQQQQQPGVVSSAGSTNSSPVSQMEDAGSTAAEAGGGGAGGGGGSAVQTQQQQQQQVQQQPGGLLKMNGFSTSPHTVVVSRLPNKKARSPKRRKRKDPNEPQKPVSAYSLFFRNAQAAIKSQNPSATFGDVSKIVASMWDSLDDDVKNFYKRQMEVAKKEYLKQLAIYRATLVSKQDVQGKTISEVETGLSAPSSSPSAPPLPSKVEEGSMSGLRGLSPVATSICMSSSGYHGNQVPMSPEAMSHVMMSPPTNHLQTTLSPRYYSDGPPTRGGLPPGTYCTSSSDVNAMRNAFLPYSQKLDHESLMSGIPEHGGGGYFLTSSSIPDAAGVYKNSREYIALENNFVKRENDD